MSVVQLLSMAAAAVTARRSLQEEEVPKGTDLVSGQARGGAGRAQALRATRPEPQHSVGVGAHACTPCSQPTAQPTYASPVQA